MRENKICAFFFYYCHLACTVFICCCGCHVSCFSWPWKIRYFVSSVLRFKYISISFASPVFCYFCHKMTCNEKYHSYLSATSSLACCYRKRIFIMRPYLLITHFSDFLWRKRWRTRKYLRLIRIMQYYLNNKVVSS